MVYDPSRTPVRELILQDLESTLAVVAPPSYKLTIRSVYRFEHDAISVPETPAVVLVDQGQDDDDSRLQIVAHRLNISAVIAIEDSDWRAKLNDLLSDFRVAVLTDHTRAGQAVDTKITGERVLDTQAADPYGAAQVDLVVIYRTLYDDPTTPI